MVTLSHILIFVTVLIGLVSSVPVRVKPDVNLGCMLYQVYLQNYATEAATSADYDAFMTRLNDYQSHISADVQKFNNYQSLSSDDLAYNNRNLPAFTQAYRELVASAKLFDSGDVKDAIETLGSTMDAFMDALASKGVDSAAAKLSLDATTASI